MTAFDPRFKSGVERFNREEFFEAHEDWEELWRDTHDNSRDIIQGLIQVTSALHHLRISNMRGARLLHDSSVELLAPYGDFYRGVDLKKLREDFDRALKDILLPPLDQLAGRGHPGPVQVLYRSGMAFKINLVGGFL